MFHEVDIHGSRFVCFGEEEHGMNETQQCNAEFLVDGKVVGRCQLIYLTQIK